MQKKKKNVPERPHTVKNITGRSYKFPLETVIEMCISGHVDCRFFFVIMVLLALKSESASCLSPRQQKPWDQKTTAGYLNSTKKSLANPGPLNSNYEFWKENNILLLTQKAQGPRVVCSEWNAEGPIGWDRLDLGSVFTHFVFSPIRTHTGFDASEKNPMMVVGPALESFTTKKDCLA